MRMQNHMLQKQSRPCFDVPSTYSLDLSLCSFWLFEYIKRDLEDEENKDSLFKAVSKIVQNIPEEEYRKTSSNIWESELWTF